MCGGLEMQRMRALVAIAIIAFGLACDLAGITAARAADVAIDHSGNYPGRYSEYAQRAGQVVIYDDQPGVFVRAYWSAPWRHQHYYPYTGKRPRIGRVENLSVRRVVKPAESYHRFWSTSSAFLSEQPRSRMRDYHVEPAPHMESLQK